MLSNDILAATPNIDKATKVVVSLSGGLDSTVLTYLMVHKFGKDNVHAISFNYNQRHDIELTCAKRTVDRLGISHYIADISFLGHMASGVSAMVKGSVETPTMEDVLGDPQPVTYMPNRNMILAAITASYAESIGANGIALGIQNIDSYSYWDTSPDFYEAVESVLRLNRKHPIYFLPAFLRLTKADEISIGAELGVDFGTTWTCYSPAKSDYYEKEPMGGRNLSYTQYRYKPCGMCPSCFERAAAFKKLGLVDPVVDKGVVG